MLQPQLIALVDDDAALREALSELLAVFDFECLAFAGPRDFLHAQEHGHFGCLITDLNMPGMDGITLLQQARARQPGLPVILISAQVDAELRGRALRSGALAYLSKPIDDLVLHRHLIAALNRRS